MEIEYKIIIAEAYSEFKKEANGFFPDLSDHFLWHFWNEIEKSANEQENLFDKYHRRADETIVSTLAGTTFFSDYNWLDCLHSYEYPYNSLDYKLQRLIYALLPIKDAFLIIYMPKKDQFSKREFEYIDSCIQSIHSRMRLLCVVKETTGDLRLEAHVTRSR